MNAYIEPNLPAINRDELLERMMGSVQMANRMLGKFIAASQTECDSMESAARRGDTEELASLAHRQKGTAKTMAAIHVADFASRIEEQATSEPISELLDLVDQIRQAYDDVRDVFGDGFTAEDGS